MQFLQGARHLRYTKQTFSAPRYASKSNLRQFHVNKGPSSLFTIKLSTTTFHIKNVTLISNKTSKAQIIDWLRRKELENSDSNFRHSIEREGKLDYEYLVKEPLSDKRRNRAWFKFTIFGTILIQLLFLGPALFALLLSEYDHLLEEAESDDIFVKDEAFVKLTPFIALGGFTQYVGLKRDKLFKIYSKAAETTVEERTLYSILEGLSTLLNVDDINIEHGKDLPWRKIFENSKSEKTNILQEQALRLAHQAALLDCNAVELVKSGIIEMIEIFIKDHDSPLNEGSAAHIITLLSRNDEARRLIGDDKSELLIDILKNTTQISTFSIAQEGLSNLLSDKWNDKEFVDNFSEKHDLPDYILDEIINYRRKAPESSISKMAKGALTTFVAGNVWGSLRWSLRYSGFHSNVLKIRAPLTGIGALLLWLPSLIETEKLIHNPEVTAFVIKPIESLLFGGLFWAGIGVFPYSIIPSFIYPLSSWASEHFNDPMGDHEYDEINKYYRNHYLYYHPEHNHSNQNVTNSGDKK